MSGSNPLAAVLASEGQGSNPLAMAGGVINLAKGAQDVRTSQFNLQQSQLQPGYQAMRMLMATNPNPSDDDVMAALGGATRLGGNVDGIVQNFTNWRARGGTPADFMRATALGGMSPEEQGRYVYPQRMNINTGSGTYYGTTPGLATPNAGQFNPAGFAAQGFTPAEATEMITVTGPDGRPYQVPKGVYYGTGTPGSGGGGGGSGGGGGVGVGGVGGAALLPPGAPADVAAARIDQIGARESGNQNIPNRQGPRGSPLSSASGPYQFLDSTWQQAAREYGIQNPTPRAMDTDPAIQRAVAIKFLQNHGEQPWATSAPGAGRGTVAAGPGGGAGGGGGGGGAPASGPFIGATSVQPTGSGGGMQYLPASPGGGQGGGGFRMPGVVQTPSGPILTPPAPWMGPIWEQSAKQYSADVDKEGGLAMRIQPFQSALSIMRANPDLKTGPTSQQWNAWATTLQQYGVSLPSMPADSVTAYQELGKNLARGLVAANAASSPTDMARLEAEASMPSTQMTPDTIRQLVARQIGYERFQVARLQYFRTLHPGEDPDQYANQYRSQTSKWASNLDPVAFGADNMTDQDIANYEKGLSPAEKDNFRRSVREASKLFPEVARAGQ